MQELILAPSAILRYQGSFSAGINNLSCTKHSAPRPSYGTDSASFLPLPLTATNSTHFCLKHPFPEFSLLFTYSSTWSGHLVTVKAPEHKSVEWKQTWPSSPMTAHLFQANMPPMVEAKMIARITQQIMIMIFFCSSRQGKKRHMSNDITVQETVLTKGKTGASEYGQGYKGNRSSRREEWWIWLLELRVFIKKNRVLWMNEFFFGKYLNSETQKSSHF